MMKIMRMSAWLVVAGLSAAIVAMLIVGTMLSSYFTSGQEMLTWKGHTSRVTSVAFSPDGKRLASASGDGRVKVWDARPLTPEPK